MKINTNIKDIAPNRNLIAKLLLLSIKANGLINFKEALKYLSYTAPLCLAHRDGLMRKSSESKLVECIIPDNIFKMKKSLPNT